MEEAEASVVEATVEVGADTQLLTQHPSDAADGSYENDSIRPTGLQIETITDGHSTNISKL